MSDATTILVLVVILLLVMEFFGSKRMKNELEKSRQSTASLMRSHDKAFDEALTRNFKSADEYNQRIFDSLDEQNRLLGEILEELRKGR